ncbi:hypothetical protein LOAG_13869 [Loa loa]|uniref:Uncharacterized protein n=1 Tax=Loa loa TaxID=7209 RepID=A0A1S0TIS0_LOALO|nr:hypothetical protein LOAG_13869 [Loa loa]EFO14649.1 hypothetical protein LOAG_13869 [Loa loa]
MEIFFGRSFNFGNPTENLHYDFRIFLRMISPSENRSYIQDMIEVLLRCAGRWNNVQKIFLLPFPTMILAKNNSTGSSCNDDVISGVDKQVEKGHKTIKQRQRTGTIPFLADADQF